MIEEMSIPVSRTTVPLATVLKSRPDIFSMIFASQRDPGAT